MDSKTTTSTLVSLITFDKIKQVCEAKNYWFPKQSSNYDMFVFGVRSFNLNQTSDSFNDVLGIAYYVGTKSVLILCSGTTDPGKSELTNPSFIAAQQEGTAIVKEGQYRRAYKYGYHGIGNWRHKALIQVAPITIYRDRNGDTTLDIGKEVKTTTGLYGINIHGSTLWDNTELKEIGRYSAGCQVFNKANEYKQFMQTCEYQIKAGLGDTFSYTLFNEHDFTRN